MSKVKLLELIDIGANLTDSMYLGIYNGRQKHAPDLQNVLDRSWEIGLRKMVITGTDLNNSIKAVKMANLDDRLFSTMGCHPTNCNQMEESDNSSSYLEKMIQLYEENSNKIVAIGEFGLDFDRLQYCPKEVQLRCFEKQLIAFAEIKIPLFLHCRNAADDLIAILSKNRDKFIGGVVHSFDGNLEQAQQILDLDLFIGINGCSLKTEDNVKVVQNLSSDKILIETDSPWCEVRPTHAGYKYIDTKFEAVKKEKWVSDKMVKGRNEPCNIIQVLEILSKIKQEDIYDLGRIIYENTEKLFFSRTLTGEHIYKKILN